MPEQADTLLGRVVGEYRLTQVIGANSMSFVFRGQRVDDPEALVAVKVLQPPPTASPEEQVAFSARCGRELRAASRLRHAHIVPILSCGEVDGRPYLAQPLLTGGTLAARLASQREPLPLEEAERYVRQLASALDYAHEQGVVHRDVKPQNVLLDAQGTAYLSDFGIARLFAAETDAGAEPDVGDFTTLTSAGVVLGTPRYMAPEQIQGEPVGPAADIYALGVVLYQLVTGRAPFTADTPFAVALQQVRETPVAPHLLRPALPLPAAGAILRALAKRPEERFSSARALARAFAAGLEGRWSEGLSPQATALDQDATLADLQDGRMAIRPYALPGIASVSASPASGPAAPVLWPVLSGAESPRLARTKPMRRPLVRGIAFVALGGLALFALGWGGGALLSALLGSRSAHTPPIATATATSAPSITIGVEDQAVYAVRASDNTILWTYPTDGNVLPSPPVVNGVVYAATDEGHLYALQIVDGTKIWSTHVAGDRPTGSPAVANDVVYVATEDGHVSALQAGDGSVIWQMHVHVNGHVAGSPTVSDGTVTIQAQNGNTYTLRASDGTLLTPTPTSGGGDNG